MAVAFRSSTSTTVNGTSQAINVPTGVADGDVLILAIMHSFANGLGGASALTGWTLLYESANVAIYRRIAASEPANYTPSWTSTGNTVLIMHAYSGGDATNPVFVFRAKSNGSSTSLAVPKGWANTCDYMAVTFAALARSTATFTQPTGYTLAETQNPSGGTTNASIRAAGAYKSFTAQLDLPSTSWTSGNSALSETIHLAIRTSGDTALAMRAMSTATSTTTATSHATLAPQTYRSGDLLVIPIAYRRDTAHPTVTPPSGWTQKGTWQQFTILPAYYGIGLFYKVAAGGDDFTFVFSGAMVAVQSYAAAFAGPTADTTAPPGTMGQANDASSDLTLDVPAATIADYPNDIFLLAAGMTSRGDRNITGPSGWDLLAARNPSNSGLISTGWSLRHESGATAGATTFTLHLADVGAAIQVAIGGPAGGGIRFYATIIG